jgi:hypothetical protein
MHVELAMIVNDLLAYSRLSSLPDATVDIMRESSALQECQIVDIRVDGVSSILALLLDTRTALEIMEGNAALIVARGLSEISWEQEIRKGRTAWNIVHGNVVQSVDSLTFEMSCFPAATLRFSAAAFELYVIDVMGIGATPPDFMEASDSDVQAGIPQWGSMVEVLARSAWNVV